MPDRPGSPHLTVGGADPALDQRLSDELDAHNTAASGVGDQRELTVRVEDGDGQLVAGLSGWTWGTCAGIAMLWVRADSRRAGWGGRLLEAAERTARERGCEQVVVSSFTFQAPGFYERHGYVETGRTGGLPVDGASDVHFHKRLAEPAGGDGADAARPLVTDLATLLSAHGTAGYRELLRVPALSLGLFAVGPGHDDVQEPHSTDEVYVVVAGAAVLVVDGERTPMSSGSVAYVPAGVPHRFVGVTDDLRVMVVFAPPED